MEHPHEPLDSILEWQRWYKENRSIPIFENQLKTTVSQDIPTTMTNVPAMLKNDQTWRQSIVDAFADSITEAMADMTGAEIYKCVLQAAQENLNHYEEEYKNAKQLVDYLTNKQ